MSELDGPPSRPNDEMTTPAGPDDGDTKPMSDESTPSPEMGSRRRKPHSRSPFQDQKPSSPIFELPSKSQKSPLRFRASTQSRPPLAPARKRKRLYSQSPPRQRYSKEANFMEEIVEDFHYASSSSRPYQQQSSSSNYHPQQSSSSNYHPQQSSSSSRSRSHSHHDRNTNHRSQSGRDGNRCEISVRYSPTTQTAYFVMKNFFPCVGRVLAYTWKIKNKVIVKDAVGKARANRLYTTLFKKTHTLQTRVALMWKVGNNLENITRGRLAALVEEIYETNQQWELVRFFIIFKLQPMRQFLFLTFNLFVSDI